MANNISISVIGDVKDINNKLGNVEKQLGGFGKSIGKVGGLLKGAFAFAAGAAVVGQIGDMVGAASDLNETLSKSKTIFGPAAADIEDFGNKAAKALGLSKEEAIAGAAQFGNFFDQIGVGKKASADLSKSFLQMSGDIASFNNADPSQVMEAFQSATRGEYDALQQFIPTINAATVEQEALRASGKKSAKDLTVQDKAIALHTLAVKGQGKAQGDFARTSKGAANQQRILTAQWKNAQATIGTALLPILTKLLNFISDKGIPAISKFADYFKTNLLPAFKDLGSTVGGAVLPVLKGIGEFFSTHSGTAKNLAVAVVALGAAFLVYKGALTAITIAQNIYLIASNAVKAGTAIWTGVQWLLNASMFAFPLVWIIAAIVAVIAIIVLAIKYHKQIGAAVVAAWNTVKKATIVAWNAVKSAISTAINAVKNAVSSAVNAVKNAVSKAWGAVKSGTAAAWNAVKAVINAAWNGIKAVVTSQINSVVGLAKGIGKRVTGAVGNLGGVLKGAGRAVISGLISGIEDAFGNLKNVLSKVTNIIPDWKGPMDKDKKLLTPAGKAIMGGLIKGIDGQLPALKKMLGTVSGVIVNGVDAQFAPSFGTGNLSTLSTNRGANIYVNNTVNAPVGSSPALIGKEIQKNLQAYVGAYGKAGMRNLI